MLDWWDDNKEDIICALYTSGSSPEAVTALSSLIEDAIQAIVTWGALEPIADKVAEALGGLFGFLVGNGLVEPLFKIVASVTDVALGIDCGDCEGSCGMLCQTGDVLPEGLVVGTAIEYDYYLDGVHRALSSTTDILIDFDLVASDVDEYELEFDFYWSGTTTTIYVLIEEFTDPGYTPIGDPIEIAYTGGVWTTKYVLIDDKPLSSGGSYRLNFGITQINENYFTRAVRLECTQLG